VPPVDWRATTPRFGESGPPLGARPRAVSQLAAPERREDMFTGDALARTQLVVGCVECGMQARPVFVVEVVAYRLELDLRSLGEVRRLIQDEPAVLHPRAHRQHGRKDSTRLDG
jgi:hypothetical protein